MKPLPAIRHEVLYGTRLVRCFAKRPANLDAMLKATLARHPGRTAFVDSDRRLTYSQFDARVEALAAGLLARGIAPGDRVALLLDNEIAFAEAFFAAARIGVISVPLNTRQRRPEIAFALNQNGSAGIIAGADHLDNLPPRPEVPSLRTVWVVGGGDPGNDSGNSPGNGPSTLPEGCEDFEALAEAGASASAAPAGAAPSRDAAPGDRPRVDEEDVLCLLYTSGTTGKPKGAMLTHVSAIHSALHYEWTFDLTEEDVAFLAVPGSHVTGLIAIVLASVLVGATTVMVRGFRARDFLELAERERITYSVMVPAMYNLCLLDPEFTRFDLASWRLAGFGGAPMPQATIDRLARAWPGMVLCNAYGSTETTSPVTVMPMGAIGDHGDTVGKVLPLADVIIADDAGREVPPGERGELLIAGPMVVPGYWDNPEGTAKGFIAGHWVSGDVGTKDADGYVRIVDRKKDMINRAGFKIYSIEVEDVLAAHPEVVEAALVGTPDPVLGERSHAFVVPRADCAPDAETLRAWCAERVSNYKVPDRVTLLDAPLARNANGKVLKPVLRDLALDEAARGERD